VIHNVPQKGCDRRGSLGPGVGFWRYALQIRCARLTLKRIAPFRTGVLIATFRCGAPARCGAFVDEGCMVAGDRGAGCGREVLGQSHRAERLRGAGARTDKRSPHTAMLIATFRCAAPERCGAGADERRIVAGDGGGRVLTRNAHNATSHLKVQRRRAHARSPGMPAHAGRWVIAERARPWSHRSPRALRRGRLAGVTAAASRAHSAEQGRRKRRLCATGVAHRHLPLRCALVMRRVRR
jgi:hypothetical protein